LINKFEKREFNGRKEVSAWTQNFILFFFIISSNLSQAITDSVKK